MNTVLEKKINPVVAVIFGPPIFLAMTAINTAFCVWDAFALTILYRWFALPLGAPIVSIAQVAGLGMAFKFLITRYDRTRPVIDHGYYFLCRLLSSPILILTGWLIKRYVN